MQKRFLITTINIYKKFLSPAFDLLFGVCRCRHLPTCGDYARLAVNRYGVLKGSFLAFRRFLCCNMVFKPRVEKNF